MTYPLDNAQLAAAKIKEIIGDFTPDYAMILGSGMSDIPAKCDNQITIPYSDLPGFPEISVKGHVGELIFGTIGTTKLCFFRGRVHYYEGDQSVSQKTMIRAMKLIGVKTLIITGAVGSLTKEVPPGSVSMIADHINFMGLNPLMGENDDQYGPRFPAIEDAWSSDLRSEWKAHAQKIGVDLSEGTYLAVLGPCYETPAEIKMFQSWGADMVGMSTVPECLIANHCGLKVIGFGIMVNYGVGMVPGEELNHDNVLEDAKEGCDRLQKLLFSYFKSEE